MDHRTRPETADERRRRILTALRDFLIAAVVAATLFALLYSPVFLPGSN